MSPNGWTRRRKPKDTLSIWNTPMMKRAQFVLATFGLAVTLAACGGEQRESLVVYTPHGKELLTFYEEAFEAAYPEVDVQWLDMGAQQVYDRVRTESVHPQASIWWGGPNLTFDQAAREGLLEAYRPSWHGSVDADGHHPEDYWYATYLTPEVIMYNASTYQRETAPADWDDLLDPEWRDRIVVRYPLVSGTMRTIFGAMILRQPTVEEGFAWLARLDMNTKTYAADPTQMYMSIARGSGDITLWNMPDAEIQSKENGYPFGYLVPESGTPVIAEGIALVKGGRNLGRAKSFYEFVTTKEALVHQARSFYRIPARRDIPQDSLPAWMRNVSITPWTVDWDRLAEEGAVWMQFWDERIKGRGEAYLREEGPVSE
jgi:iron(III) transport system substrate-binding protein